MGLNNRHLRNFQFMVCSLSRTYNYTMNMHIEVTIRYSNALIYNIARAMFIALTLRDNVSNIKKSVSYITYRAALKILIC